MKFYFSLHRITKGLIIVLLSGAGVPVLFGQCDRAAFVEDYQTFYLGSEVTGSELGWSGDQLSCISGNISAAAREKTLMRINYFRRLAKVPSEITFDEALTPMCQSAALMMHSNNDLSHDPPVAWSCYSEEGRLAASKSNLALGAHSTRAISLYMLDPGENNGPVGHRRWILYSRADKFGMGSTSRAHSLYVIHSKIKAPDDLNYIAYPPDSFFPASLLPDRWSLAVPKANFENVEVVMTNEAGENISLEVLPYKGGFGDNTLVWEPDQKQVEKFNPVDQSYQVSVSNIMLNDSAHAIKYKVIVVQPVHPPACADGQEWGESICGCKTSKTTATVSTESISQFRLFPSPADSYLQIETPLTSGEDGIITVRNLDGIILLQHKMRMHAELNLGHLPGGIYQVTLRWSQRMLTRKIVVVH